MTSLLPGASVWDRNHRWITVGAVALIFLAAIESLAVTTVLPVVVSDLGGESLYALAFAGTLATSVIGMVAAGSWCDRVGPRLPLYVAVAVFVVGLLMAGFASGMPMLIAGRLVQGLGAGAQTVALYVVVARLYIPSLHGQVFAAFAAAWVVPSMIGPFLAGAVTEHVHWRWTFLGVAVLSGLAFLLVATKLAGVDLGGGDPGAAPDLGIRMLFALLVAAGAVVIGYSPDLAVASWPVALLSLIIVGAALVPLLPRASLRAARGLPSVVLMRGLLAGAFFSAEAFIPYLLMSRFGFSPTWAGLALTAAALAWALGSAVQGRYGDAWGNRRIAMLGVAGVLIAAGSVLVCAMTGAWPAVIIVGWGIGGAGMGLVYPRLSVLTLAYSQPGNQGFNSSALTIADASGTAVAIAFAGILAASMPLWGGGFAAVFMFAIGLALVSLVPGLRLGSGGSGSSVQRL